MDLTQKITAKNIIAYQQKLADDLKLSPSTIKRRLSSIRKFSQWATKQGYLQENPFRIISNENEEETTVDKYQSLAPKGKGIISKAYKAYHQLPGTKYFHYAILIIFCAALGFGVYDQFFKKAPTPFAYSDTLNRPNRYLSFQGRLTDSSDNPISSATNIDFRLWKLVSGGTEGTCVGGAGEDCLWKSNTCVVTPDQDGIFSIMLGTTSGPGYTCDTALEIGEDVFTKNQNVWLGITVDEDGEMDPRIQVATVGYALNAETLQGMPPGTGINNIPYINNTGDIVIAAASASVQGTSGTFAIEGQTGVTIQAGTGVGGSINISPKGDAGIINITSEATTGNLLNNQSGASFGTVGGKEENNLYYGYTGTDSTNLNLLKLESGSTPTAKFTIDAAGNASAAGILKALTTGSYLTGDITVSGGDITGANSVGLDIGEADANYITSSVGFAVGGAQTYYINSSGTGNLNALTLAGDLTARANATISGTLSLGPQVQAFAGTCEASTAGKMYYDGDANKYYFCNGTDWTEMGAGAASYWALTSNNLHPVDLNYNLGIGTSTPANKLSIVGNADISGSLGIGTTSPTSLFSVGSSSQFQVNSSGYALLPDGSISTPALTFTNDTDTGLYRIGVDKIGLITGGIAVQGITIDSSGNVGIGTTIPNTKLHVVGNTTIEGYLSLTSGGVDAFNTTLSNSLIYNSTGGGSVYPFLDFGNLVLQSRPSGAERDIVFVTGTTPTVRMVVSRNGNIGIGTTDPANELDVVGTAQMTGFKLTTGASSGYVLTSDGDGVGIWSTSAAGTTVYVSETTDQIVAFAGNCPAGWEEYTGAQGRTIVGVGVGGSVGGTVGIGLTNLEDRMQVHTYQDATLGTSSGASYIGVPQSNESITGRVQGMAAANGSGNVALYNRTRTTDAASITMPYVQLRYCKKVGGSSGLTDYSLWYDQGAYLNTVNNKAVSIGSSAAIGSYKLYVAGEVAFNSGNIFSDSNNYLYAARFVDTANSNYFVDPAASGISATFNGSVGIGTTNPATFKLQIAGDLGPDVNDTYNLGSDSLRWADLYLGPGTLHLGTDTSDEYTIGYDTLANRLEFNANGSGNAEVVIDSSGNVGIGTTDPQASLTVSGNAIFGNAYAGSTAPSNGIIVEGSVGIGTPDPLAKLHIEGGEIWTFNDGNNPRLILGDTADPGQYGYLQWDSVNDYYRIETDGVNGLKIKGNNVAIGNIFPSQPLIVGSGTTELFRINSSGFVGINNTNPLANLDIIGDATLSGTLSLAPQVQAYAGACETSIAGKMYYDAGENKYYFCNGTEWIEMGAGATGGSYWGLNGDNLSPNAVAYNVGIGTSTPTGKFEVAGTAWLRGAVGTSGLYVNSSGNIGIGTTNPQAGLSLASNMTLGSSYVGLTAPTNGMIIQGNVGIGTTSPTSLLSVGSSSQFQVNSSGYVLLPNGSTSTTALTFNDDTDTGLYRIGADKIGLITGGSATKGLTIDASGNVGIGTTTPANKLDIAGTAQMTGFKLTTGAAAGYVLSSDSTGVGTWTDISSTAGPWTLVGNSLFPDSLLYNVGIGTTGATAKLEVVGDTLLGVGLTGTEDALLVNVGAGFSGNLLKLAVNSAEKFAIDSTGQLITSSGTFLSTVADSGSAIAYNFDTLIALTAPGAKLLSIKNAGDEKMSLDKDGVLALYNSNSMIYNSAGDITIAAASGNVSLATNNLINVNNLSLGGVASISGSPNITLIPTADLAKVYLLNGGDLGLYSSVGGDTGVTEKIRITNDGSIGIGTTDPGSYKLYVAGTASFNSDQIYTDNNNYINAARFVDTANSSYFVDPAASGIAAALNGNVGIGTPTPVSKIQIEGSNDGKALAILNELGTNDILTASASGTTRLTLTNEGNLLPGTDDAQSIGSSGGRWQNINLSDNVNLYGKYVSETNYELGKLTYDNLNTADNSLDFQPADESSFSQENLAYSVTLTPSATTGDITLTLGSGNWNTNSKIKKGTRVVGNGGIATITTVPSASSTITALVTTDFSNTNPIASGSWQLYGTKFSTLEELVLNDFVNNNDFNTTGSAAIGYFSNVSVAQIGTDKALITYEDYDNRNYGTAIVASISGTTITYGTKVIFNTAETSDISAVKLDTDKALITYSDYGNSDYGTAIVASVSGTTITYGAENVFNGAGTYYISASQLTTGKALIAYDDGGNSDYGTAIVASVSGTTITYGAENVFESAVTSSIAATQLTTDKAIIAYKDEGNSNYGTAVVASVSGTTITYPSAANVFESATTSSIAVAQLTTDKAIIAYKDEGNSNYGTAVVASVSGTTITYPSAVNVFESASTTDISVAQLTTDKALISYSDVGNSDYGTARVASVSGTTITYPSAANVFESATTSYIGAFQLTTDKVLIGYKDEGNGNYGTAVVASVSGTTITYPSAVAIFTSGAKTNYTSTVQIDTNKVLIAYQDGGNSNYGTAVVASVSDTAITYGSEAVFNSAATSFVSAAKLATDKVIIGYSDEGNSDYGTAIVASVSGTTITYGSEYEFNSAATSEVTTAPLTTDKAIIAYSDVANSSYGAAVAASASSLVLSYGSEYEFNSAATSKITAAKLDTDKAIIAYSDNGNSDYGTAIAAEASTLDLSYGSEYVFNSAATYDLASVPLITDKALLVYSDNGNSDYGTAIVADASSLVLAYGSEYVFNAAATYYFGVAQLDTNKALIAYDDSGNSDYGTTIVSSITGNVISFGAETVFNSEATDYISVAKSTTDRAFVAFNSFTLTQPNGQGIIVNINSTSNHINNYPTDTYYTTNTTDLNQLDASLWADINSVTITETLNSQTINYAASFDDRITWKIYDLGVGDTGWRPITRNNSGTWEYNANVTAGATDITWTAATTNTQPGALDQAFQITANQMTGTELNAITSSQWEETGGFTPVTTTTLDFAFGLKTTNVANTPSLSQIVMDVNHSKGVLALATESVGGVARPIKIAVGAVDAMFVDTTGNIGIGTGTTTPIAKVQIEGTNTGKPLVILNETGTNDILNASSSGILRTKIDNNGSIGIYSNYVDTANYEKAEIGFTPSTGSTNSSLDFQPADESSFSQEDLAFSTTLTPSATTGDITLTLGSGHWDDNAKVKAYTRIVGNGGTATISEAPAASSTINAHVDTDFTNTNAIASGDWKLYGTKFSNLEQLVLNDFYSQQNGEIAAFNEVGYGNVNEVKTAKIDTNKVLIVYADEATEYGKAIVASVSGTTVTYGTETNFTLYAEYISVAPLSTDKAIIAFYGSGGSLAVVASVSGTTITFGTEVTFNDYGYVQYISAAQLTTDKAIIAYYDGMESGNGNAIVASVSGTTITYGAENTFNAAGTYAISAAQLTTDKAIIAYSDNGASNYGNAIVASVSTTTITYGAENTFNAAATWHISAAQLTTDKAIIAYSDNGASNYGNAIVASVSTTTITYGAENTFNAAATYAISAAQLTTDKAIIAYTDEGASDYGNAIVASVSTTTITYGAENTFNAAGTYTISAAQLTTDKAIIGYDSQSGTAVVASVSTTTITYGTEGPFNQTAIANEISVAKIGNNKVLIAYSDNAEQSYGNAIVASVSGTTITYGTEVTFNTNISLFISAAQLDSNKALISYTDGDDGYGKAIVASVSGTAITFGEEVTFSENFPLYTSIVQLDTDKVLIAYENDSNQYGETIVASISGTAITFGSIAQFTLNYVQDIQATKLDNDKALIAYIDSGDTDYGTAIVASISGTTVTYGSPAFFDQNYTPVIWDAANIETNKAIITFSDSDNFYGNAVVASVSGTTISYGTKEIVSTNFPYYISIAKFTDKALISYADGNDGYGKAVVTSVSGTNLSFGAEFTFNEDMPSLIASTQLNTGSAFIGFNIAGTTYPEASGLAISFGNYPTNDYYVTTTSDISQLSVSSWSNINSITAAETLDSQTLNYGLSFDDRVTYNLYDTAIGDTGWRPIVRNNSNTWQYNSNITAGATNITWTSASTNTQFGALDQAFQIAANQMTGTELSAITSSQWKETNGFIPGTTITLNFAYGLKSTDVNSSPSLEGITALYDDAKGVFSITTDSAGTGVAKPIRFAIGDTEAMFINTEGDIGIGTTTPRFDLQETVLTTKAATLPTGRELLSCAENSDTHKIYCFGGYNDDTYFLDEIVEYDPATDQTTTKTAVLPSAREGLSCAENSDTHKIYCFGGYDDITPYLDEIIEYDPVTDQITTKTAVLSTERESLSCAENSDTHKIYCFGGYDDSGHVEEIAEYDTVTDQITAMSAVLPVATEDFSCVENSDTHKIYCFGGCGGLDLITEYDPATDQIAVMSAALPTGRDNLSCAENSDTHKIYCFGGYDSPSELDEIIKYDPVTDEITTETAVLPTARDFLACAENSDTHKIYCFGGDYDNSLDQIVELGDSYDYYDLKLDVTGNIGINDDIFIGNITGTGADTIMGVNDLDLAGIGNNILTIKDWGKITIDEGINLGIGTATPLQEVHVYNSTDNADVRLQGGGSSAYMDVFSGSVSSGMWGVGSTNPIVFATNNTERVRINGGTGNLGVGTATPDSRLQVTGGGLCVGSNANCNTDNNTEGIVYSSATAMSVYDVAENYPTKDATLRAGEVVVASQENEVFVERSATAYSQNLLGIISTEPGVLLGGFAAKDYVEEIKVPIALSGRVPVYIATNSAEIKVGDFLTSSDEPGKAMKAEKTGITIGKALESWDPESGKETVMTFVNLSWNDPNAYLTNNGELKIISQDATYSGLLADDSPQLSALALINQKTNQIIKNVGAFANLIVANIKAGRIETQELVSTVADINSINSDQIETNRISLSEISISSESNNIILNLENQNSTESAFGKLIIKGEEGQEVASIDAQGNASFAGILESAGLQVKNDATISGTLYAEDIITKDGRFSDLLSASLSATYITQNITNIYQVATSSANQTPEDQSIASENATDSALLADESITDSTESSSSAIMSEEEINNLINEILASSPEIASQAALAENIEISPTGDLLAMDYQTLNVDSLNIGNTLTIANDSLNSIAGPLYLQNLGLGGVDILAGKIVIDQQGNTVFESNVTIKGKLAVNDITPVENDLTFDLGKTETSIGSTNPSDFGNILVKGINNEVVASIDASGSAQFTSLGIEADYSATQSGTIIAAFDNWQENGEYSPAIKTNAAAGVGILPTYEKEIIIYNSKITDKSLIYITPITDTNNKVIFIKAKKAQKAALIDENGEYLPEEKGWFKVSIDMPIDKEISFNWWIVN